MSLQNSQIFLKSILQQLQTLEQSDICKLYNSMYQYIEKLSKTNKINQSGFYIPDVIIPVLKTDELNYFNKVENSVQMNNTLQAFQSAISDDDKRKKLRQQQDVNLKITQKSQLTQQEQQKLEEQMKRKQKSDLNWAVFMEFYSHLSKIEYSQIEVDVKPKQQIRSVVANMDSMSFQPKKQIQSTQLTLKPIKLETLNPPRWQFDNQLIARVNVFVKSDEK